nr:hypothetical transcript [Hymenolepis microstoma]
MLSPRLHIMVDLFTWNEGIDLFFEGDLCQGGFDENIEVFKLLLICKYREVSVMRPMNFSMQTSPAKKCQNTAR